VTLAVMAILVLLLIVAVVLAMLEVELAWTVAIALFAILVISVGAAVLLGGGPKLTTNPIGAVRNQLDLAAYVAIGLTVLVAVACSVWAFMPGRRRRNEAEQRGDRKEDS
jgi:hypothetical protein